MLYISKQQTGVQFPGSRSLLPKILFFVVIEMCALSSRWEQGNEMGPGVWRADALSKLAPPHVKQQDGSRFPAVPLFSICFACSTFFPKRKLTLSWGSQYYHMQGLNGSSGSRSNVCGGLVPIITDTLCLFVVCGRQKNIHYIFNLRTRVRNGFWCMANDSFQYSQLRAIQQ